MEKEYDLFVVKIFVAIAIATIIFVGGYQYGLEDSKGEVREVVKTVEKEVVKEVHDTITQASDEQVIGTANIPVPSSSFQAGKDSADHPVLDLPIVQKTYSNDTLYTAYVSGVKYNDLPKLDSINVKQKTIFQTVTITREVQQKRSSFDIGAGGFYQRDSYGVVGSVKVKHWLLSGGYDFHNKTPHFGAQYMFGK